MLKAPSVTPNPTPVVPNLSNELPLTLHLYLFSIYVHLCHQTKCYSTAKVDKMVYVEIYKVIYYF